MRLNMKFAADMAKTSGGAGAAYLYEEIASQAVVEATSQDGRLSLFDIALQLVVGWGPFVVASHLGGPFWGSFAGAIAYNRVDNLAVMAGQRAQTPMGYVRRGETLAEARARLGM